MKNIKIISFLLLGLLLLVNCDGEDSYADYTAPDEFSDVTWLISLEKFTEDPYSINAGTFMSFMDLSQGAVSHEWIIQEGNYFLNDGFSKNDSLPLFINYDDGTLINRGKANVYFLNNGYNTVRLYNKFKEPVSYKSSAGTFNAVQEGDLWVIDTTFTFDVYADLEPAFTVLQDDVEILKINAEDMPSIDDEASWPSVDVEAGSTLTLVDNTTIGRPNARQWVAPNGILGAAGKDTTVVKFFKLGLFDVGSLKSQRVKPLPVKDATKLIPLKANVIPSSQPFVFDGNLTESEAEKITFRVTGEVEAFSGQEDKFTVHVINEAVGFDQNIQVQSARVDPTNATLIELTLSGEIYNSDVITVSYNGTEIESTDTRVLQPFESKNVQMFYTNNILAANSWSGFEPSVTQLNRAYAGPNGAFWVGPNGTADDPFWSRTEEKVYEGSASMRFSVDGIGKNYQLHTFGLGTIDKIPAGTYKVSFMVYLEPGNTMGGFYTWGDQPTIAGELWDVSSLAQGKWLKMEKTFTTNTAINAKKKVSVVVNTTANPDAATGRQTMYLDNLSFIELEVRP